MDSATTRRDADGDRRAGEYYDGTVWPRQPAAAVRAVVQLRQVTSTRMNQAPPASRPAQYSHGRNASGTYCWAVAEPHETKNEATTAVAEINRIAASVTE